MPAMPEPYDDELLSSWIERASLRAGMTLNAFLKWIGAPPEVIWSVDIKPPATLIRSLSGHTGVSTTRLLTMRVKAKRTSLPSDFRQCYCVACWDEDIAQGRSPYIRKAWADAWTVHCCKHKQLLTDLFISCDDPKWMNVWSKDINWARAARTHFNPAKVLCHYRALAQMREAHDGGDEICWLDWLIAQKPWCRHEGAHRRLRIALRDLVLIAALQFPGDQSLASKVFPGKGSRIRLFWRSDPRVNTLQEFRKVREAHRLACENWIAPFTVRRNAMRTAGRLWVIMNDCDFRFSDLEAVFQQFPVGDERSANWLRKRVSQWPKGLQASWNDLQNRQASNLFGL